MQLPAPQWIALAFGISEIALSLLRRSGTDSRNRDDRGSLQLIWIVILVSMGVAMILWKMLPQASLPITPALQFVALAIFCCGVLLRWYSIVHLGKYFTVDVAVAVDHKVIDTGPYRYVRHPSYTGALLAFFGLALYTANMASLAVMMTAVLVVFMRRIRIEEQVLQAGLGQPYTAYMRRTKRLIPFIY